MKKRNLFLMALAVGICLVSCEKEEQQALRFTGSMEQCSNRADSKMRLDGNLLKWNEWVGDMIGFRASNWDNYFWMGAYAVPHADDPTCADFDYSEFVGAELVPDAVPPFKAWYPAEINSFGHEDFCRLPSRQVDFLTEYRFEMPMYAVTNTTNFSFRNLCGLLKIHLPASSVSVNSISISTDVPINGEYSIGGTAMEPALTYLGNGSNTTTMYHTNPDDCSAGMDFYIYLPAGTYSTMTFTIIQPNGDYCIKTGHNIVVERSMYSTVNIATMNFVTPSADAINGRLSGLFSINSDGDQIYFSQGNLQYRASDNIWRFALRQYDFVGTYNSYGTVFDGTVKSDNWRTSATYSGWIDLFGWGTSGWDNGNLYYRPYDTEEAYTLAPNDGYGPTTGSAYYDPVYSLTGVYANADWGVYNPISNGGNRAGLWRTLTYDEFRYIISGRPGAASKCLPASVGGIPGLILLPDQWNAPAGIDMTYNDYNPLQWSQLEAAGAVFLPVSGCVGNNRENPCEMHDALYWTSTNVQHYAWDYNVGYLGMFAPGIGTCQQSKPEWYQVQCGYCGGIPGAVRLVQDAD